MNTDTLKVYKTPEEVSAAVESGEVDEQHLIYGDEHAISNLATELRLHRDALKSKRKRERQNKKNGRQ